MNILLNVYDNIRTPYIKNSTTIQDWFNLIKQSDYSSLIEAARPFGKKHPVYENNKAVLPAITYNFTFTDSKANNNISGATGLLYIDIDDSTFDINSLDTSKIFAYYKSFGGTGYAVLVQVSGLTLDNYSSTYYEICEDLGLSKFYDKGAKKATQFNVLSYDPNIFINYDSFVFEASNDFVPNPVVIREEKKTYTTGMGTKFVSKETSIRFNNLNEIEIIGEYLVNWSGWEYVKCWLPFRHKVKAGNRNNMLLSYCNNLVWLNPDLTIAGAETILKNVNKHICEEPVADTQIKRIVASVFKYKADGTLQPVVFKQKRKILFAPVSKLSAKEKFKLCGELLNEKKRNDSQQKINDTLLDWNFEANGKITVRAVARYGKMNKKTVEKYWSEFKQYAQDLNDNYKDSQVKPIKHEVAVQPHDNPVMTPVEVPEPTILKVLEAINTVAPIRLSDVKMDSFKAFNVANSTKFDKAVKLLSTTPKIFLYRHIDDLLKSGYEGEEVYQADDYQYTFNVYSRLNTIEFKAVA